MQVILPCLMQVPSVISRGFGLVGRTMTTREQRREQRAGPDVAAPVVFSGRVLKWTKVKDARLNLERWSRSGQPPLAPTSCSDQQRTALPPPLPYTARCVIAEKEAGPRQPVLKPVSATMHMG